jgi:alcohol dehydrogenase
MKSVQINRYGSSEVLEINQSAPEPKVSVGKVLVMIKAAGVNPVDWKIREGYMRQRIQLQFPSTLGMDFSGVVKQIGAASEVVKDGDEIYGQASVITGGSGAFAEMAIANAESIATNPNV